MPRHDQERGISPDQRGTPVVPASRVTVERLQAILLQPVAPGSTARRDTLERFFSQELSPTEAARLYSQLSTDRDSLRRLMESRLHHSSVPKLLTILRQTSGGHSARTAPENLDDISLENAFMTNENRLAGVKREPSTSLEQVQVEARAQELYEEKTRRGTAQTEAPEHLLVDIELNRKLNEATQAGNYAGVDVARIMRRLPGNATITGLRRVAGHYRFLKITANSGLEEVRPPNERLELDLPMHKVHDDPVHRHLIVRLPLTGRNTDYLVELWWEADRDSAYDGLLYYAGAAAHPDAKGNLISEYYAAILARPFGGDELEQAARFKLALSAPGALSGPGSGVRSRGAPRVSKPTPPIPPAKAKIKKPKQASGRTVQTKPMLSSLNVKLSGDTAGTGGIKSMSAHREQDGSLRFEIKGELKPPLKRSLAPNYNEDLPTGKEIGLPNYQRSHLWGPGFGDEARDGIAYAPKEVNQAFQNRGVESRLRDLQKLAKKQGATIELTAKSETYPSNTWKGHEMLKEAGYHFEVHHADGKKEHIGQVDISVSTPTSQAPGKVTVNVIGGSGGVWSLL